MKRSLWLVIALSFAVILPVESQGLMNRVKKAVSKEVSGILGDNKSNSADPGPEPTCACQDAKLIVELGKGLNLDYKEISITILDDGSLLLKDRLSSKYYIVKDGNSQGPYDASDPRVRQFDDQASQADNSQEKSDWTVKFPDYITKSGDKYLIRFNGKSYGPYALISDFAVSRSKDKFAAVVTETVLMTEAESKKMEEAMKNAKSDQERIDISMKLGQQMQQQMIQGGGPGSIQPKLVTNIAGAKLNPSEFMGGRLNSKVKFDDIVVVLYDKIVDLQGNSIMKINQNDYASKDLFVNESNSRYAVYNYGALTFSDNTSMTDLFNPGLVKTDGKVFLTYMYYSPGKNAIMQCAVPF